MCVCVCVYIYIYSCAHKFTYHLQNMQNVQNFNKIPGIMKIACYFVCSTVLNKLFHITEVYTPPDKIITEFIKMIPFESLHTLES